MARILRSLLATALLLRRAARPAASGQAPGGRARGVPRSERRGGFTRTALPASRHVFGVRADRHQRDTLLLSRMAVRGGRDDPRDTRRPSREHPQGPALSRGLSYPRVQPPRLCLFGPAGPPPGLPRGPQPHPARPSLPPRAPLLPPP